MRAHGSAAAAQATVRDPGVARAIITAALALAALLPLLVTAYALRRLPDHLPADELLMDTMLNPLILGQALIIPREEESDALPANPASRLPDLDDRSVCGNVNGD